MRCRGKPWGERRRRPRQRRRHGGTLLRAQVIAQCVSQFYLCRTRWAAAEESATDAPTRRARSDDGDVMVFKGERRLRSPYPVYTR